MDFLKEILTYIWTQKKWWMAPLITILLLIGLFVIFAESAIAPFIYTLF